MRLVHRIAVVGVTAAATLGIAVGASQAHADTTGSATAARGGTLVQCGHAWSGYNRCVKLRRQLVREGTRISKLYYDPKGVNGCPVSPGCKYHFYYYH
jgi:hypothetical protein